MASKVFIVHGHDSASLVDLKNMIEGFGLIPVVLKDQGSLGMTIVEKFERYASTCHSAVSLLTPDDKQASELPADERFRARQNVIFETGWFIGSLGRRYVTLLHKGKVELPLDLLGVIYLPFNGTISVVQPDLRRAFIAQGLI